MTEYTLEALVKLGMIEYALIASVDPCGSLLAEGIAECHYTGPQPVTVSFYKTEAILDFIRSSKAPMTTALIPSGLISLVQPLDTAVNGPFKQLLQEEADIYVCELVETGKMPDPWTLRNRREMATVIVGRAWERLQKDPDLIKRAFLHYGISIHPDGTEDHLINIKKVDNSSINPNEWRSSSEYRSYEVVSEDFDYMTALISAAEELKPSIKTVTLKQLQEECVHRGLAKSGTKPELLAKLQAY
jgi:hypothetical protein